HRETDLVERLAHLGRTRITLACAVAVTPYELHAVERLARGARTSVDETRINEARRIAEARHARVRPLDLLDARHAELVGGHGHALGFASTTHGAPLRSMRVFP